jgi:succinate dehydrogenase / fumarate reductase membrane anchor subunit
VSWRLSSGLRPWLLQRLSAVYILLFLGYLMTLAAGGGRLDFVTWRTWLAHPGINTAWALFFLSLLLHAWVGGRDVILDYLKPYPRRLLALILFGLGLLVMGLWVLRVLFAVTAP